MQESGKDICKVVDNIYTKDRKDLIFCPTGRTGNIELPNGVDTIKSKSFFGTGTDSIRISDDVTTIEDMAFSSSTIETAILGKNANSISRIFMSCNKIKSVVIDSQYIASMLGSNGFASSPEAIYIKNNITEIGTYITSNYELSNQNDREGYVKHVKK